jgi:hypothetical protein
MKSIKSLGRACSIAVNGKSGGELAGKMGDVIDL